MNKQAFLSLLKDPKNISSQDLKGLEEVIVNFPFCQAAHILAAKGANDHGKMLSDKKIRKAAAYTSERKNLKKTLFQVPLPEPLNVNPTLKEERATDLIPKEVKATETSPEVLKEEPEDLKNRVKENFVKEVEKAKEETKIKSSPPAEAPSKEEARLKPGNAKFFAELEENLRSLRALKENAVHDSASEEIKEDLKEEEVINKLPEREKEETKKPIELLREPIKEHADSIHLFSSRLDEIIEEKNAANPVVAVKEAELLLNYLSFLENHKNSSVKDKKKTEEIIEQFIKKDPSIPYMNSKNLPDEQEDKASQSYRLKGGLLSENMANIYVLQGKKERAIEIYQQLLLKNPEKRAYFEAKIEKIKGNQ